MGEGGGWGQFSGIIAAMLNQFFDTRTCFRLIAPLILLILSACGASQDALTPTLAPATQTSAPPTATPIPMAATVNGEIIPLDVFNAELGRFQGAQNILGKAVSLEEAQERVLGDLIDQLLLSQAAREAGFSLEDAELDARLATLAEDVGGEDILSTRLASLGYTSESFRQSLKLAIEAAWMRDNILANLPSTAEQVHAQQILLYNQEAADEIQLQLANGVDFGDLATAYDPNTSGELGWFPRGYLLEKEIEDVAFLLEIGVPSETIETEVGFHIIMVLERDEDRPLSPDALLALEEQALRSWLQNAR